MGTPHGRCMQRLLFSFFGGGFTVNQHHLCRARFGACGVTSVALWVAGFGAAWGTSVSASLCVFGQRGARCAPPPYAFSFPFTPEHYMCLLVTEAGSQMGNA